MNTVTLGLSDRATANARVVEAMHGDITALLNVGILQKNDKNKINFPFDGLHVDFELLEEKRA